jgi:hypothetical protein
MSSPFSPAFSDGRVDAGSAFDGTGGHAGHDLPVEGDEEDERRQRDQQDVREEQVVLGGVLALEVEERQLNGRVLVPRQEVQRVDDR